jgi:hypothetical protein
MAMAELLREGARVFDTRLGRERLVYRAELMGNTLSPDQIEQSNEVLIRISPKLRLS